MDDVRAQCALLRLCHVRHVNSFIVFQCLCQLRTRFMKDLVHVCELDSYESIAQACAPLFSLKPDLKEKLHFFSFFPLSPVPGALS